jgi:hypothetical protein
VAAGAVEICRFATVLGHHVPGGFQKIFSRCVTWAREAGFKSIMTYADLLTGDGSVYIKAGFTHVGRTGLSYWYSDGRRRFDRFKFRAKSGKSEREVASEAGVFRVYGCGSNSFTFNL